MGIETNLRTSSRTATSAMTEDSPPAFSLPAVSRKKVTAAFDGGRLSSDSGVMPNLNTTFCELVDPKKESSKFMSAWHYALDGRGAF